MYSCFSVAILFFMEFIVTNQMNQSRVHFVLSIGKNIVKNSNVSKLIKEKNCARCNLAICTSLWKFSCARPIRLQALSDALIRRPIRSSFVCIAHKTIHESICALVCVCAHTSIPCVGISTSVCSRGRDESATRHRASTLWSMHTRATCNICKHPCV